MGVKKDPLDIPMLEEVDMSELKDNEIRQYLVDLHEGVRKERELKESLALIKEDLYANFLELNNNMLSTTAETRMVERKLELVNHKINTELIDQRVRMKLDSYNYFKNRRKQLKDNVLALHEQVEDQTAKEVQMWKDLQAISKTYTEMQEQAEAAIVEDAIVFSEAKSKVRELYVLKEKQVSKKKYFQYKEMANELVQSYHNIEENINQRKRKRMHHMVVSHLKALKGINIACFMISQKNHSLLNDLKIQMDKKREDVAIATVDFQRGKAECAWLEKEILEKTKEVKEIQSHLTNVKEEEEKCHKLQAAVYLARKNLDVPEMQEELLYLKVKDAKEKLEEVKQWVREAVSNVMVHFGTQLLKMERQISIVKYNSEYQTQILHAFRNNNNLEKAVKEATQNNQIQESLGKTIRLYDQLKLAHSNLISLYSRILEQENLTYDDLGINPTKDIWDKC